MAFPSYTKTFHNASYPAINPSNPALSTAGKVVVITGAGTGVGQRTAHAFACSGANKIAILGRTASSLLSTKTSVEAEYPGTKVLTFTADITDRAAIDNALSTVSSTFGPISVLVANAAYLPNPAPIGTGDINEWFRGMEVNVKGNLNLLQAFLVNCSENPTVVHITSGGAHLPPLPGGMSSYAISKLAATRVMDCFMFENPHVRVMNVHPGVLDTAMNRKAMEAGLVMPFDDIELSASFVVWAVSPEAEFLKGKLIWSNWDVEEMKAKKEILETTPELTIGLIGWGA